MAIVKTKPTINALRQHTVLVLGTNKKKREKSLSYGIVNKAGRNNRGVVTAKNRGGGARKVYREVDFKRTIYLGMKATVIAIEYDPNRTANIALIRYENGHNSYIIAPEKLKIGSEVICDEKTPVKVGNRMMLKNIPPSTEIYNIELNYMQGGKIVKSAGGRAILLGTDENFTQIKLPSGEVRKISSDCMAEIGVISNADHNKVVISKAGRKRLMGVRPHVRGKAKNPCDHPHGGGEGNTSIGMKRPKTPWGMPALGHKTRKAKKPTTKLILKRRK